VATAVPTDKFSDAKHDESGTHNDNYDHDAFLGKDHGHDFDELSPEESKKQLGKLFHKVDKDGNGLVTLEEMKFWIKYTQERYVRDDANNQFGSSDADKDGKVSWAEWKNVTYGPEEDDAEEVKKLVEKDEKRFNKADKNGDKSLDKDEFVPFMHPENDPDMKSVVVEETLADIDKDHDGKISIDEYIGDLWPEEERGGEEPEWLKTEREQFTAHRDKDKNGFMDKEEVADWIMPDDFDHIDSEASHLVSESDTDKDGSISKEEMIEKYELFVGSQATDFGEALKHEEL